MKPKPRTARLVLAAAACCCSPHRLPAGEGPLTWGSETVETATLLDCRDGGLDFRIADETRRVSMGELVHWSDRSAPRASQYITLRDGSLVTFDEMQLIEGRWEVWSPLLGRLSGNVAALRSIVFQSQDEVHPWARRGGESVSQGVVLLAADGDAAEGKEVEIFDGFVYLAFFDDEIRVEVERAAEIRFAGEEAGLKPQWYVGLSDGSLMSCERIEIVEQGKLLTLSSQLGEVAVAVDDVSLLQSAAPKTQFLSDASPVGYQHAPLLGPQRALAIDRNVLGELAALRGAPYLKLLGFASGARVAYNLPSGEDDAFLATQVALDDSAGDRGSAVVRVFAHGDRGWTERATSDVIRGGESPASLTADLSGAAAFAIVVEYADGADVLDRVNLLNARLTTSPPPSESGSD